MRPFLLCTVDERNYRQFRQLISYCATSKLGFRLSPVRDDSTYKLPGLQQAMTEELIRLYREMGESHPLDLPIGSFGRFADWDLRIRKNQACGSCKSMLAVGDSGQVASCQMRLDHPVASVRDDAFDRVFETLRRSDDYQYFVHPEAKTGKCAGCAFKHTCAGGCPEHTRMVFGSNNHASPWCDLYTAMMPEYVSAIGRQMERVQNAHGAGAMAGAAARSAPASAQWCGDPSGRHEYRYWDGTSWTDHVADSGQAGTDPW
jgi:radical SAM protein with 4Fe4S-binding SPASM domain